MVRTPQQCIGCHYDLTGESFLSYEIQSLTVSENHPCDIINLKSEEDGVVGAVMSIIAQRDRQGDHLAIEGRHRI